MSRLTPAEETVIYGCTTSAIEKAIHSPINFDDRDVLMLAMSIISDAQEVLAMGSPERSRQYMNRAKYVISHVWQKLPRE